MAIIKVDYGEIGGGNLTLDTFVANTGTVSSSASYTFTKDFKLVVLIGYTNANNPTWYTYFTINGNTPASMEGGNQSGSVAGGSSYTNWVSLADIKNGDVLKYTNGSWNFILLGFNDN